MSGPGWAKPGPDTMPRQTRPGWVLAAGTPNYSSYCTTVQALSGPRTQARTLAIPQ